MAFSYNKQDLVTYNSSQKSAQLEKLVETYGDCLERLSASEKLHLLGVLTAWQALDTELQEVEGKHIYTLPEALEDYNYDIPDSSFNAIGLLKGIADESAFDLMVAIANQLKDGIYRQ